MNIEREAKKVEKKQKRQYRDQFAEGTCCPSFPTTLRNRIYQHYGYEYKGGQYKYPIAFWILVERLLNEVEERQPISVTWGSNLTFLTGEQTWMTMKTNKS